MDKTKKIILWQLALLVVAALSFAAVALGCFIFEHEMTHRQIFYNYGYESRIEWGLIRSVTYRGDQFRNVTPEELRDMNLLHTQLEIQAVNTKTNILIYMSYAYVLIGVFAMFQFSRRWEVKQCSNQ